MSKPYKRQDSRFWWIAPVVNGVQAPQSSKETDYGAALQKLKLLEGKIADGRILTPKADRGLFGALLDAVTTDYEIKKRRSIEDMKRRIKLHLRPALGRLRCEQVNSLILNDYIRSRQQASHPAANSSINRELAIIKRAFRLGEIAGVISRKPFIEMLPEDNDRDGYYSPVQFQTVLGHCSGVAVSILWMAYVTGWRFRSILRLEWRQVDLKERFVWLNAKDTKNRKAVRWPLVMGLGEILDAQRALTTEVERRKKQIIPYVFHREGVPVRSIRTMFENARTKAGLPGRRIHDFRGTAIVNLLEAGVDPIRVMNMVGLKSIQMIDHYARRRAARDETLINAGEMLEKRFGTTISVKSITVAAGSD